MLWNYEFFVFFLSMERNNYGRKMKNGFRENE